MDERKSMNVVHAFFLSSIPEHWNERDLQSIDPYSYFCICLSQERRAMPKMKSRRAAKKRFKKTAKGKIKRNKQGRRHILTKKSPKKKRQMRKAGLVDEVDEKRVRRMLNSKE